MRLSLVALLTLLSLPAHADSHLEPGIALTTDRVWRGLSQTRGGPGVIGEVKWKHDDGPFAGLWMSNVAYDGIAGTSVEAVSFAGYAARFGETQMELGVLRHIRPARGVDLDYTELSLFAARKFGPLTALLGGFYSPHTYLGGSSFYPYLDLRLGVGSVAGLRLALTAHAGTYRFSQSAIDDYVDWRFGLAASGYGMSAHATVSEADIDPRSPLAGARRGGRRFSLSVTRMF